MRVSTKAGAIAALLVTLIALALAITSGCGTAAGSGAPSEAKPAVPPETAVHYAVQYARASRPGPCPLLVGEPTEIRGKVMAQEEKGDSAKPGPPYQRPTYQGLWVIEADGSGAREVFANADPLGYQNYLAGWTPDGRSSLYWEGRYMSASMIADGLPLMQVPPEEIRVKRGSCRRGRCRLCGRG